MPTTHLEPISISKAAKCRLITTPLYSDTTTTTTTDCNLDVQPEHKCLYYGDWLPVTYGSVTSTYADACRNEHYGWCAFIRMRAIDAEHACMHCVLDIRELSTHLQAGPVWSHSALMRQIAYSSSTPPPPSTAETTQDPHTLPQTLTHTHTTPCCSLSYTHTEAVMSLCVSAQMLCLLRYACVHTVCLSPLCVLHASISSLLGCVTSSLPPKPAASP